METTNNVDAVGYNRAAWNRLVQRANRWTVPVTAETVARARRGDWQIILTPTKAVPGDWFGDVYGKRVLCLGGGGGQQAPILAAAGARVTTLDNSEAQLAQDQSVAAREQLEIRTVRADMSDLNCFDDNSFDLIVNPCSVCFVPDVLPVWRESFRVLDAAGKLMSGLINPVRYLFDLVELEEHNRLLITHSIPYSDQRDASAAERRYLQDNLEPLEFGHTLADLVGGQIAAGFRLIGWYEDNWPPEERNALGQLVDPFIATCVEKPVQDRVQEPGNACIGQ